jgi:dTDP-4-dehydrorhamnose reductase
MTNILILGDSGLIGSALAHRLCKRHKVTGLSRSNLEHANWNHIAFDLLEDNITTLLEGTKPDVIVSCVRGDFIKQLEMHHRIADFAISHGTRVVFFSTANVFDSQMNSIKTEEDKRESVSDYGQFKIACEDLLSSKLKNLCTIIRIPMVFGANSKRVTQIIEAINDNKAIEVYENLDITTLWLEDLVIQTEYVIDHQLEGVLHITSTDVINQLSFYQQLISNLSLDVSQLNDGLVSYFGLASNRPDLTLFSKSNDDVIINIKNYIKKLTK